MKKWCVITGNPVDGIFVYGPFDSTEEATEWCEENQDGQDWWLTELLPLTEELSCPQ